MDGHELFRQEVVDAQATTWLGSVRLATPISHRIWTLCSVLITAAVIIWLYFGHYTRREHVTGNLVPQAGLLTVSAQNAGVISRLLVSEGQVVKEGEPLLSLSSERSSLALGNADENISAGTQPTGAFTR